jgi:nucleotide-binding universal stress UspA family protein
VILICYDGSADAKQAITHGARMLRGQRETVLTVWSPFDTAALGLSGGVEDMQASDEAGRLHAEHQADAGARLAIEWGFDAEPRTADRRTTIADAIHGEADALDATAILIGSRGVDGREVAAAGERLARGHPARRPDGDRRPLTGGGSRPRASAPLRVRCRR